MEYIVLVVSLATIVLGANCLVDGAVSMAKRFGVSDFVIGAIIIGIGTSMPELVVSFVGALKGNSDVAIGNVVGSNIYNIFGILGLTALFFPVDIDRRNIKFEIPLCIAVSILLTAFSFNGISRFDGLVLLVCFVGFMWYSLYRDRKRAMAFEISPDVDRTPLWIPIAKVTGGLLMLVISCDFFIDEAVLIAQSLGVDDAFISLTLVAYGTSLPELAASITAALKKNTQMAVGNIVGSNIFNITFILGLSSQVMPLTTSEVTLVDYIMMTAASILLLAFGFRGRIGRIGGLLMFVCLLAYNWYLFSNQMP